MKKFKVKYNSVLALPITVLQGKRKPNYIYGRVLLGTIHFTESKDEVLKRNDDGTLKFEGLLLHELQHVYQADFYSPPFKYLKHGIDHILTLIKLRWKHGNWNDAYLFHPDEIGARSAESGKLTEEEFKVFATS